MIPTVSRQLEHWTSFGPTIPGSTVLTITTEFMQSIDTLYMLVDWNVILDPDV